MVNVFVLGVSLFVCLGTFICGYLLASTNGTLEMNGFQDTFRDLYEQEQHEEFKMNQSSLTLLLMVVNDTGPTLGASADDERTCSSGNGASSDLLIGLVISGIGLGAGLGSLVAGWIADQFSRKYGLTISGLVTAVGSTLSATSFHIWQVIAGSFISGLGIGITYMIIPVYISEIAPKKSRGMLGSLMGPTFALGNIISLCCNVGYARFPLGWRITFIVIVVMTLIYSVGMAVIPHTPRWLMKKNRDQEALLVLSKINSRSQKETFVETCLELEDLKDATRKTKRTSVVDLLRQLVKRKYRFLIALALYAIESATGNIFYYYATTMLCEVVSVPFLAALVVGLLILAATITATTIIDRVGRRSLMLGCTFVNVFLGLGIGVLLQFHPPSEAVSFIVVALISTYVYFYTTAWLVVPWIFSSEIFPLSIRGFTVALLTGAYWFMSFLVNQATPIILGSPIRIYGYFYIITGINIVAVIFIALVVPETKGVSLEKMEELFAKKWTERLKWSFSSNKESTKNTATSEKRLPYRKEEEILESCNLDHKL